MSICKNKSAIVVSSICATLLSAAANAGPVDTSALLQEFNVLALDSFNGGGSEVQGSVYVGGDLTGDLTVVNSDNTPNSSLGGTLVVGGDLIASATLQNGDAVIGGTINSSATLLTNNGSASTGVGGIPTADVSSAFRSLSTDLATLSSSGDLTVENIDVSFFDIPNVTNDLNSLFGPGTTLVNVSGTSLADTSGFNFNGDFGNVIFNFFEANDISITTAFGASILAPFADISNTGGGINGTVVGASLFNQSETRSRFTGELPAAVPVPSAFILMFSGLTALVGIGRRRAKLA